jgi:hypothetical protein
MKMDIKEGSALETKDSKRISYDRISVTSKTTDQPLLKLTNTQNVRVTNCYQPESIPLFINEDEKSSEIYVVGNIFPATSKLVNGKGSNLVLENNLIKK